MAEKIAEHVYKIHAEGNVYLLLKPRVMVIDTSAPQFRDMVKKEIDAIVGCDKVEDVLLTHLHFDHCGNVMLFPNATVHAPKKDLDAFIHDPASFFVDDLDVIAHMADAVSYKGNEINGLAILEVPGHTCGSVAFLDKEHKILFSGDTLFEHGIGRYDLPNAVPENVESSVLKLKKLVEDEGYLLCAGHDY